MKQERDMLMKRCDEATREAQEKSKETEEAREREREGRRAAAEREADAKEAREMLEGERGREARAVERMKRAEKDAADLQKEVVKLRSRLDDAVEEMTRAKEAEGGYRTRLGAMSEQLKAAEASAEMAKVSLKEKERTIGSLQVVTKRPTLNILLKQTSTLETVNAECFKTLARNHLVVIRFGV